MSRYRTLVEHDLQKRSVGFPLIELLMTVTIIGVLASIALPLYEGYVQRTHVGATIQFLAASKTAATAGLQIDGTIPVQDPIRLPGDYLQCVTVDIRKNGERGDCNRIHITAWPTREFDRSVTLGRTRMLELYGELNSASGAVDWLCGPFPNANRNIDSSLLPATCQDTIPRPSGQSCLTGPQRAAMTACRRNL